MPTPRAAKSMSALPNVAVPAPASVAWTWTGIGIAAAIAAVATLIPYHRGLSFPFAADDYTYLYDVSGLDPRPFALRRWLATQAYYAVAWRWFDSHETLWHLWAYLLHIANAVWVYLLALRFRVGRNAAWIAAGLFAASPIAFTVLYWIACIQELGSAFYVFAAAWVMTRQDRWRWSAVPLFVAAVLCKESVLMAPLVLAWIYGRRVWRVAGAMLGAGVVTFIASGLHTRMFNSDITLPYSVAYDKTIFVNLATHFIWFVAPWRWYPDRFSGPHAELVWPAAAVAAVLGAVALAAKGRGRLSQSLLWAAAWFVALLLPVLPLRQHSYAYYSYLPQAGFLILAGAGLARLGQRLGGLTALAPGAVAIAALVFCAAQNTRTHEKLTLPKSLVPHDPMVRSGRANGALVDAIRDAHLPPAVKRVGILTLPEKLASTAPTPSGPAPPGAEMVRVRRFPMRDAFRDGKLIALHFPNLRGVWVDSMSADFESPDTALWFTAGFNDMVRLPSAGGAWQFVAQGYLMTDDRQAARQALLRAVALEPENKNPRVVLAGLELEAAHIAEATDLVRDIHPEDVQAELRAPLGQIRQILGLDPPPAPAPVTPAPAPSPGR